MGEMVSSSHHTILHYNDNLLTCTREHTFEAFFNKLEPSLPLLFPGSVNTGEDVYVWQLLAAMGVSASHDQQTRLVLAVKDRVLDTVTLAKTLPPAMASDRLGSVNLFMRSIGLDVELLQ
jgi:DNA topoisomerase 2-associated protein PAT1